MNLSSNASELLKAPKNTTALKQNLIKPVINDLKYLDPHLQFNLNSFKAKKCTYLLFGKREITQDSYNCLTCDPGRNEGICKDCLDNCHKDCKRNMKLDPFYKTEEFVCSCGSEKKHLVNSNKIAEEGTTSQCKIFDIDS